MLYFNNITFLADNLPIHERGSIGVPKPTDSLTKLPDFKIKSRH